MEQHHISQAYEIAAETIKNAILQGQYEAAKGVNRIQLATYFSVGKYVSANTRQGVWGTGALEAISTRLRQLLPGLRGYSSESLKLMRKFYEGWKSLDAGKTADNDTKRNSVIAITELENSSAEQLPIRELQFKNSADFPIDDFFNVPFTHHTQILAKVKSLDERLYYIHRCAEEHMSVETLKKAMANDDYYHQSDIPNNFTATISKGDLARKAVMAFKDEYLLNFINVEEIGERDAADIDERMVEQQIIHNIKKFIMTFGHDFAFVGNQYRMEIYGVEHFPDLVFFNRELNALVVIELKTGEFKTSYLGQLNAYLAIADDKIRKPHENPTIGIVLCRSANKNYAEYMVRQYDKPMGVAIYKTSAEMPEKLRKALPSIDELKKLL
uniref:PDDEXK nuclease domain-containing protein n=1 Tax=Hoylesella pleuritidis TaxID=407975 RepID=UPI000563828C|nr:PDDEXK nuclease domain-containing protein [Hoylesella pleuritidis]